MKTKFFPTLLVSMFILITLTAAGQESYEFEDQYNIETTEVKSQDRTGTCWSYATTSFIETELLRMGMATYDLSEMYFARLAYEKKADLYVKYHGRANFGQGGQAHDVMNAIRKYGFATENAYSALHYGTDMHMHGEMEAILQATLDAVLKRRNRALTPVWKDAYSAILDVYLGEVPKTMNVDSRELSPKEFQEATGFNPDDYVEITSYTHQEYYEPFILEVPDNWSNDLYYNLPLDEMMEVMKYSLKEGYSFVFDGDVSSPGFSHKNGVAVVAADDDADIAEGPVEEKKVDAEYRQMMFENLTATDDHLMHITDFAYDKNDTPYYKTKNSWGTDSNDLGGYLYMSEQYMRLNTVAIMVHKDAIPGEIQEKLGLE